MTVFALVDCNNFYASCEKLFRPDLQNTPIVVLSNNDGCVVARSSEAKSLGIKMGVPIFQIQAELKKHRILTFSSNYPLYADLSNRVMNTLEDMVPKVEVYSIDEAFLDLSTISHQYSLTEYGHKIKNRINQWIGLSVCVGIAPTKTLAKLANHAAKKYPRSQGIVDLTDKTRQRRLLAKTSVESLWGIGRRLSKQLQSLGIHSALELADAPPKFIRKRFSVVLEKTVRELNGESCLLLEEQPAIKKQIVCSRSFGSKLTEYQAVRQAICRYTSRCAEKLRQQDQKAKFITVFLRTSPFNEKTKYYRNALSGELLNASNDTRDFIHLANQLLRNIWKEGYSYAKAGVMLSDFYDASPSQPDLFDDTSPQSHKQPHKQHSQVLMSVIDEINQSGLGRVFFAGQGTKKSWPMKQEKISPAYTTRWDQLPRVL